MQNKQKFNEEDQFHGENLLRAGLGMDPIIITPAEKKSLKELEELHKFCSKQEIIEERIRQGLPVDYDDMPDDFQPSRTSRRIPIDLKPVHDLLVLALICIAIYGLCQYLFFAYFIYMGFALFLGYFLGRHTLVYFLYLLFDDEIKHKFLFFIVKCVFIFPPAVATFYVVDYLIENSITAFWECYLKLLIFIFAVIFFYTGTAFLVRKFLYQNKKTEASCKLFCSGLLSLWVAFLTYTYAINANYGYVPSLLNYVTPKIETVAKYTQTETFLINNSETEIKANELTENDKIKYLQSFLKRNGVNLTVDGIWGKQTKNELFKFMKKHHIKIPKSAKINDYFIAIKKYDQK